MFNSNNNIFIALSYRCNAFCKKCMTRYHKNKDIEMSKETIDRIVYLLKKNNFKGVISVGTGEPLLYENFEYFFKSILGVNDHIRLRILSNGMLFNTSQSEYIFDKRCIWGITLDGFNQDSIVQYQKGVDIEIVKKNISDVVQKYGSENMYLNYTVYRNNLEQMLPFCKFAVERDIHQIYFTELKVFSGYEKNLAAYRIVRDEKFYTIITEIKNYLQQKGIPFAGINLDGHKTRQECFKRKMSSPIIDVNGCVSFCSGREDIYVGSIYDDDIAEKWQNFKEKIIKSSGKFCRYCFDNQLENGNYLLPKTINREEIL